MANNYKARAEAAEEGLFRVVQVLGYDMDGARNAAEFFGPLSIRVGGERIDDPAGIAVWYATDHRKEAEEESDKYEAEITRLKDTIARLSESVEPSAEDLEAEWRGLMAALRAAWRA